MVKATKTKKTTKTPVKSVSKSKTVEPVTKKPVEVTGSESNTIEQETCKLPTQSLDTCPSNPHIITTSEDVPPTTTLEEASAEVQSEVQSEVQPDAEKTTTVTENPPVPETLVLMSSTEDKLTCLLTKIMTVQSELKSLLLDTKNFQRQFKKEKKEMEKVVSKSRKVKKKSDKPRAPSGFAKPTKLSDELCSFLSVDNGTELARTEVTKRLISYIKNKKLQNPEAKKEILCDTPLNKLLSPGDNTVTFFNLQTFMKHHFPLSASASTSVST